MENTVPPTIPPKQKTYSRLLRLCQRILIGAIIMFCLNFVLKLTGWESWKIFSKQTDDFAETMMDGTLRLSPFNLWKSIKTDLHTYKLSPGPYISTYTESGKLTLKNKILNWLGYYWFKESGKAFWIGRLLLIGAIIAGISLASEDYKKSTDKSAATVFFIFNVLIKFFMVLLVVGLFCLLLFIIIKLFLAIGSSIVFIASAIHATGGFTKLLLEESKEEATISSKEKIATLSLPFLFKKKK